jgi:hypothetical protein
VLRAAAGRIVSLRPGERAVELTVHCEPRPTVPAPLRVGPNMDPAIMLQSAVKQAARHSAAPPDFGGFAHLHDWRRISSDAWEATDFDGRSKPTEVRAKVRSNGALTFSAAVGGPSERDPMITVVNEVRLAAHTVRALALAGQVIRNCAHHGLVDVGVLVRPMLQRSSMFLDQPDRRSRTPYLEQEHLRHITVLAEALLDAPREAAHPLIDELIEALVSWGYDPFDSPWA